MGASTQLVGQTISHYRILEKIGGGGMGVVYKAEDTDLGRFVALKFLPEDLAQDQQALERFRREARAASALNHPNICTIHEIGKHNGQSFIVMEYLEGTTLKHRINGKAIDARADLFSLGAVVYEMASGKLPFNGESTAVIFEAILNRTPVPLQQLNHNVTADLERIVNKCLEKDRNLRYQHASEIRADLQRLRRDTESGRLAAATSVARNGRVLWVAAGAVVLIVAAVLAGYILFRRPAKLTAQDSIVLADFANSTGDPVFDDTLKTALTVALRQSPFLNLLSDDRVSATLKLMTRPANTPLVPEVTREVCQRARGKAYIAGSVTTLGTEYVIGLKAVNCQGGDTLAQEQITAPSKEKVLGALGEAASKLRGELGESLATVEKFNVPLEEATTSSLDALKAYSRAHYERAIELDPNFALGYWMAGIMAGHMGNQDQERQYLTRSFQLREHAGERERLTIEGTYYHDVTGELDKAERALREVVDSYPRLQEFESMEASPHVGLGDVYMDEGRYEDAEKVTRRSLRFVPHHLYPYLALSTALLALQDFDEARQIVHEGQSRTMDGVMFHADLYALAFIGMDSPAMAEEQRWFAGSTDYENYGLALASDSEAYAGHLRKARDLTKRSVDTAIHADSKENGAMWQENAAVREITFGNTTEAKLAGAAGLRLAPANEEVEVEAALAFAMAGDVARAESLIQDLNKRFPLGTQMQSLWLPTIQAQLALDQRNPALALNTLKAALSVELGRNGFVNISCLYPVYVRGEAYLATRQGKEAATEFQKILDHSGIVWNCWTGALAHLGVARANALQAKTSQGADSDAPRVRALAAYKDFLTLWKDADSDIPILKQAKAEYEKLQ